MIGPLRIGALALCLSGAVLAGRGLSVPVEARIAQVRLNHAFEQSRAEHAAVVEGATLTVTGKRAIRPAPVPTGAPLMRVSVERLGVREVVLAGPSSHDQLKKGPAVVKAGDAMTILAAHRDTHFAFIRDLREGDDVTVEQINGAVERYRVMRFETVRWDRFAYPLDPARPLLALTTCYPFGGTEYGGPLRRVVWAERV